MSNTSDRSSGLVGALAGSAAGGLVGDRVDKLRQGRADFTQAANRFIWAGRRRAHYEKDRAARTHTRQTLLRKLFDGVKFNPRDYQYRRTPWFQGQIDKAEKMHKRFRGTASKVKPIAAITGAVGGGLLGAFIDKKAEDISMIKKADVVMEKLAAGGFARILGAVLKRMPALTGQLGSTVQRASKIKTLRQLGRIDDIMESRKLTARKLLEHQPGSGGGFNQLLRRGRAMDDAALSQNAVSKAKTAINAKYPSDPKFMVTKDLEDYNKMQEYFRGLERTSDNLAGGPVRSIELEGKLLDKLKRMPTERMPLNITDNIIDPL